jgi:hypothetical protein
MLEMPSPTCCATPQEHRDALLAARPENKKISGSPKGAKAGRPSPRSTLGPKHKGAPRCLRRQVHG